MNPKITSWTDGFPYDSTWMDLTPKRGTPTATVKLPPYRVSDKALAEIDANERQAATVFTDKTIFD